ncbi:Ubiquitin-associated domain-containing protein [Ancistrocladus abbreviatus]
MDSNSSSPAQENNESKAAFRKPTTDAANRKYRRRSPASMSSSPDGSPKCERSQSPLSSRDEVKGSKYRSRKDDWGDTGGSSRSQHGRSTDASRYSSRRSQGYSRHDNHSRQGKYADEEDRNYSRLSSRSSRETRGSNHHADYKEREHDYNRSRDRYRGADKFTRDKSDVTGHASRDKQRDTTPEDYKRYAHKDSSSDKFGSDRRHGRVGIEESRNNDFDKHVRDRDNRDEKRDYRNSRDHRSDRTTTHEESRGHRSDTTSKRDSDGYHVKGVYKDESNDLESKEEKKRHHEQDVNKHKDTHGRPGEFDHRGGFSNEREGSAPKRPKLFSLEKDSDQRDEGSKEGQQLVGKVATEPALAIGSGSAANIDAAKVAAMKAAELVNQNLAGTGFMTTDQKKKLLWGNKKNTSSEESSHRWDTTLFSDHERQEKFNKLMGVKGDVKVEQRPNDQDGNDLLRAEKQRELQLDLEKQYTAGLRRRDGRTVGPRVNSGCDDGGWYLVAYKQVSTFRSSLLQRRVLTKCPYVLVHTVVVAAAAAAAQTIQIESTEVNSHSRKGNTTLGIFWIPSAFKSHSLKPFISRLSEMGLLLPILSVGLSKSLVSCIEKMRKCVMLRVLEVPALMPMVKGHAGEPSEGMEEVVEMSLLGLPELALECILERLSPAELCSMAGSCRYLRERCKSDHLWEKHMEKKWGRLIGKAAHRDWQWYMATEKRRSLIGGSMNLGFLGFIFSIWPLSLLRPMLEDRFKSEDSLPFDSIMSWYLSLERGKFWFPAQVYNRENGHAGFMLSCYDAELCYNSGTNTFRARYLPPGRHTMEENIQWDRLRAPPVDTPAYVLYVSDCLDDLKPGDHFEIQWRRNKDYPYGWWYGVVGHSESCDGIENNCTCHNSDMVMLEFNQYHPDSRWRRTTVNRKNHHEEGNEADGFYGGIRKLYNEEEVSAWKSICPTKFKDEWRPVWIQFNNAPVTGSLIIASAFFTILFRIQGRYTKLGLPYQDIFQKLQFWKLIFSVFAFSSTLELMFGLYLLYYFRVFERQIGSNKYLVFVVFSIIVSLLLQVGALALLKDPSFKLITSGPYGLIFSSFVPFYFDIPVSTQLLLSSWKRSILPGICGILAGSLYRMNVVYIRRIKFPEFIGSLFSPLNDNS